MEKIKNLSALRIVAFAVAIAIILGLSSVMLSFTVSAENVSSDRVTLEDGTQVPTINGFSIIGSKAVTNIMVSYVNKTYGDGLIFLIAQDRTTKDIYYSRYPQAYLHDKTYMYCYFPSGYDCTAPFATSDSSVYDYFYIDDTYTAHHEGYSKSYKLSFFNASAEAVSPNLSNLNYYWCYTSTIKWNHMNAVSVSTIIGKSDNSGFKEGIKPPPGGGCENGRFICFGDYKEYTYDEHLADISVGAAYQRNDYLSSEQTNYTAFMFDDTSCFKWADERVNSGHIVMYSSTSIAFNYYNSSDSVGAVKFRVSKTQMFPSLRESDNPFDVTHYFVMKPANKHFSRYVIISEGSLRAVPAHSTATFRVNMQGYCNMDWNSYYLCEIVDVQSDTVLSSVMFVYTGKNSGKIDGSNIKDGSFISVDYEYQDGNNVNDGSLTPDEDGTLPNLPNGIKDETYNPSGNYNLSNLDISDIFSSLNQATASVGAFFQATLNIIPITIMTLIIGSLALLIVLRILGR